MTKNPLTPLSLIGILFFLITIVNQTLAADVPIRWDVTPGATGYKLQKSIDQGLTWSTPLDVGNVTSHTYANVEENTLVLFRASAYNAAGEAIRTWSGAWYDHRKKPVSSASGTGIQ